MGGNDEPTIDCERHGRRRISFACGHIAQGLIDATSPGFVIVAETGDLLPLAWCDQCEDMISTDGDGNWDDDELRRRADFKPLCEDCYAEAKGLAISAARFRNLRPNA
jgi:hypothetical protein